MSPCAHRYHIEASHPETPEILNVFWYFSFPFSLISTHLRDFSSPSFGACIFFPLGLTLFYSFLHCPVGSTLFSFLKRKWMRGYTPVCSAIFHFLHLKNQSRHWTGIWGIIKHRKPGFSILKFREVEIDSITHNGCGNWYSIVANHLSYELLCLQLSSH